MAEERNLATARAPELTRDEADPTKAELQRRMEEARDSISQTVSEIKDTVTTQYENVRESISQSLDWREQYRRRPVAFSVGALGVGFVLGYSVGGAFGGGGGDDLASRYYEAEGDNDGDDAPQQRSYAAQAITGGAYGSTAYSAAPPSEASAEAASHAFESGMARQAAQPARPAKQDYDAASESSAAPRPSYSSGYDSTAAAEESDKPSVLARFKETKAYDRLQDELGSLGERAVEELSKTARNVVLPALLGKLKDMIGIDLSTQREVAQRSRLEQESSTAQKQADRSAGEAPAGASGGTAYGSGTGGYGKSL
ncbi:MAG TPA: hypothetical protein VF538_19345 [Pyrinomonadaceae bacterium]|jgi:ElaB/YqjD/DUF883 family membrane-anchored ribosome-binding protein